MIKYLAVILVLYVVLYTVLGLILDKIFIFERSKDECKMIFTVIYIIVALILAR
nr:MAG TPA: hypothetical protein [Caudoviricetes sp.]